MSCSQAGQKSSPSGASITRGIGGGAAGLDQGEGFEQLIEGAEAAGQHHECVAFAQEEQLAGEKVAEVQQSPLAAAHIAVGVLLERQLHVQTDALLAACTAVGGLHDAAAGTGHHFEAPLDRLHRQGLGQLVGGFIWLGASRPKHRHLSGESVRCEHLEAVADVGEGAADEPPVIAVAAVAGDLQQGDDAAFDGAPLWVILQLGFQGLQRALLHRRRPQAL
jgi:hypothetical protein